MVTTHLYNLWVIEPLAEYRLYESKNLLQNNHNLQHTNIIKWQKFILHVQIVMYLNSST